MSLCGRTANHVFIFGCGWLRLSPCRMKRDCASIFGGGEGPPNNQAAINTPHLPSSPPFLILCCLQHHQCHAQCVNENEKRKMPIAIQVRADNTFLDDVIVTRKTERKRANGCAELCQSFKENKVSEEKQPCFLFSRLQLSCVFLFLNVSK
ncbi:hypothetical protein AOLI_G00053190 [Acnodon oligacanthus]